MSSPPKILPASLALIIVQYLLCRSCCSAEKDAVHSYEERLQAALDDERTFIETVYTSWSGFIIVLLTGSISAISSALIIFIILRSFSGLSSTYHRFMFGMSISDVMASTAMLLTTLLIPKDTIYTQFEPKLLGNRSTCSAQGFFFTVGSNATFGYNASLCVYYLCAIKFKLKQSTIRNRCEPLLHTASFLCGIIPSILYLIGNLYHPSPWDPWCTATLYPWYCGLKSVDDKENCMVIQGNLTYASFAFKVLFFGFFIGAVALVGSMIVITWSVYRQERLIKRYIRRVYRSRSRGSDTQNHLASCQSRHHYTKVILCQALAYIFAFLLCQSNIIISLLSVRLDIERPMGLQFYHLVTRPLQGFFNLVVFVGHKVYNLRQIKNDISISEAIYQVFTVAEEPRFFFTQISLVRHHGDKDQDDISFDICEDVDLDSSGHLYQPKISIDESGISYPEDGDHPAEHGFQDDRVPKNQDESLFSGSSVLSRKTVDHSAGVSWQESRDSSKP